MNAEPLVVTTREPADAFDAAGPLRPSTIENVHFGSIAVVSVDGRLLYSAGDPDFPTYTRSTLKPLQALPFVRDGGPARLGWGDEAVALMCASHSGEAMHTERVASMLASVGCSAADLQCGCHVPGWYAALHRKPPPDLEPTPLEHNCSGKHAGFLAACRAHGEPIERYLAPDAPVQQRVATAVADLVGVPVAALGAGTDGCSAPNFAMPLSRLAFAYAQLAQGAAAPREGDTLAVLSRAMTSHPALVSGTARSDLALMSGAAGDRVSKIGADGVQALGVRSRGFGIAIKIADGSREAMYCALLETLAQLDLAPTGVDGGAPDAMPPALRPFAGRTVRNGRGLATGRMRARFDLRAA